MPDESLKTIEIDDGDKSIVPATSKIKPITSREYAPSLTIIGPDQREFQVSTNARANRARAQMNASRLMSLVESKIDEYEMMDEVPLKLLKELTVMVKDTQKVILEAYEHTKLSTGKGSEFEQFALGAVKAAASGGARAGFTAKMNRIKQLGKGRREQKKVEEENANTVDV